MNPRNEFSKKSTINVHVEGPITRHMIEMIKKENPGKIVKINGKKY